VNGQIGNARTAMIDQELIFKARRRRGCFLTKANQIHIDYIVVLILFFKKPLFKLQGYAQGLLASLFGGI
jgi:hypothetical protein